MKTKQKPRAEGKDSKRRDCAAFLRFFRRHPAEAHELMQDMIKVAEYYTNEAKRVAAEKAAKAQQED
jgi:hypothetical protein